jgi:ABC-type transport system involved in multi-copper enzyme maturation permease subunit
VVLMNGLFMAMSLTLWGFLRDRVLHAIFGIMFLLLILVPIFSGFSMRQVQELSISLVLSALSAVLLLLSVLLGASSIWRDIERRSVFSLLGLPLSRRDYVLGKFFAIAVFLLFCAALLGGISVPVIYLSATQYPSDVPLLWGHVAVAVAGLAGKYILLTAIALLLSALSTSFFLPIFGTLAIYLAGSASQPVMDYLSRDETQAVSPTVKGICQGLYYLLPNFSAFDWQVQAVYALPLSAAQLGYTLAYFVVYLAIILWLGVTVFERRELT